MENTIVKIRADLLEKWSGVIRSYNEHLDVPYKLAKARTLVILDRLDILSLSSISSIDFVEDSLNTEFSIKFFGEDSNISLNIVESELEDCLTFGCSTSSFEVSSFGNIFYTDGTDQALYLIRSIVTNKISYGQNG